MPILSVSYSLNPENFGPDLGPNGLQKLSVDDTWRYRVIALPGGKYRTLVKTA